MSETIVLSGRSNVLESVFSPPIILRQDKDHYIGLVEFVAYNSIPNIDWTNQKFHIRKGLLLEEIVVPRGAYEVDDIGTYLQERLVELNGGAAPADDDDAESAKDEVFSLKANNSTLKCSFRCKFDVDFSLSCSIGALLGFEARLYPAGATHESVNPVNIQAVNMIRVECNLATGSYVNGAIAHTIFTFSPNVPPGFKMALSPRTIIYNRINTSVIDRIRISILDQDGRAVEFGEELVTLRLHIKSSD